MKKAEGMVAVLLMLAFASSVWLSAKAAEDTTETKQNVRKCYKCGSKGAVTMWSKCRARTVYAHKDGVDMIGYRAGLNELPTDSSGFPSYSWNSGKIPVEEGGVVVFMNKDSRFLATKVVKVKNIDDGEPSNSLHIEFKIY